MESKRRALRSAENQTNGVVSGDFADESVAYNPVRTKLSESQAERKSSEELKARIAMVFILHFFLRFRQSSFHWIIIDGVISEIGLRFRRCL